MRTILDYILQDELGRGSSCVVHRAHQLPAGETVALKAPLHDSPSARAALLREATLLRRVIHPNVAQLVEVVRLSEDDPPRGLALVLLDGPTLAQHLAGGAPLDRGQVARLGCSLARGLGALHGAGIVHADVKPANIVVRADGEAVLVDLDSAVDSGAEPDGSLLPAGSPVEQRFTERYAAPELRRGAQPSPASDRWALATLLLEALGDLGGPGTTDLGGPGTTDGGGGAIGGAIDGAIPDAGGPDPLVDALLATRHVDPDQRLGLDELLVHLEAVPLGPAELARLPAPPSPSPSPSIDPHPTVRWGPRPPDPLDRWLRVGGTDARTRSGPPIPSARITALTTAAGAVLGVVGLVALVGWVSDTFSGPRPSLATPEVAPEPAPTTGDPPPPAAPRVCAAGDLVSGADGPGSAPGIEMLHGDLDGTGCTRTVRWDPVRTEATVAWSAAPRRYRLGRPGDQLVLGDWDADGRATPGLYRPATGEAFLFDGWAEADAPLPSTEVYDTGTTAGRAVVRTAVAGTADHLVVAPPDPSLADPNLADQP